MKKVIITVCAVVAAAAAAQAQGVARDVNYFGREYLAMKAQESKQEARQTQAIEKAVRKAAEKQRHQQMLAAKAAQPAQTTKKAATAKPAKDTAKKAAAAKQPAKKAKPAAKKTQERTLGQKILAFFGGRYEWETDEEYHQRVINMGHVANQPFK